MNIDEFAVSDLARNIVLDESFRNPYVRRMLNGEPEEDRKKIFVGGLTTQNEASLLAHFSNFGPVVSAVVERNQYMLSRGFGFVTFQDELSAVNSRRNQFQFIDGRQVQVKKFMRRNPRLVNPLRLYVGGLPRTLSVEELAAYFTQFGTVTHANIVSDVVTRRSKGFGFVSFQFAYEATNAVQFANHRIQGKLVTVRR